MLSETPKFNKAIKEILADLKPCQINCLQCKKSFVVSFADIEFFNKFEVPPHKLCPECRRQRRLAFANYTTLYKRECNAPGHNEVVIANIPPNTRFPVYDFDAYWYGDRNYFSYGFDFDNKKTFFQNFDELFVKSPQVAITRDPSNINSDYTCYGAQFKNCYYIFGGMFGVEDVMFSMWPMGVKNTLDALIAIKTDFSYECVYAENCFNCNFVYFSRDCMDCSFIYDCRNCTNCFGCVNLRHKKYCIWNKQYTEDEYKKKISEINFGNIKEIRKIKKDFLDFVKSLPIRAIRNEHSENSSGNYVINCKNCSNCIWAMSSENSDRIEFAINSKDSKDSSICSNNEKLYEAILVGMNSANIKFSVFCRDSLDSEYLMNCRNCTNCFGCIGIQNGKFCIFNKQYSEKDYWHTLDKIKTKMLKDGEYGELFPIAMSYFPYNASLANIVFPISKEKVLELGGWWHDEKKESFSEIKLVKIEELPEDIKNIDDIILDKGIISSGNGKPFRLIKRELDFYKRKNLAIPEFTPYERMVARFDFVNNFKITTDKCFKCNINILSSFNLNSGYKPYCEKCYQQEVY